jgi:predicted nucleotidyltransferase
MALTDSKLAIETREGRRANIVASGLMDGVARTVTLQHGFGNSGAATSYLRENELLLRERAQEWLANPSARPDSDTTRRLLREELTLKFGSTLVRLVLTGSRARGNSGAESDWDLVAVVDGARRCGPEGPIAWPYHAPDGNPVDLIVIPLADFDHPARFMAEMRLNHTEL